MEKYKIDYLKTSSIMQLYLNLKLMVFVQISKFSDYMLKKEERIGEIYFKLLCKCHALTYKPVNTCTNLG